MAKFKPPTWTHPFFTGAVQGATACIRAIGLDESLHPLRLIGGTYAQSARNRDRLQRGLDNLEWCFPEWSPEHRREVCVESYRHLFGLAAEMSCVPFLFDSSGWPERVDLGDTKDAIDLLFERKPAILITGHCGNWEALGVTIAHFGFRMHALYRPLDLKPLDRWVRRTRGLRGLELIDKFGAAKELPEIMGRGDPLGFTADQNAGAKGIFVPFFDRLASTYKSIGLMAIQYDAPMICGHATRIRGPGGELRYRVEVVDLIYPGDWKTQPDPLYYVTARYRRAIEEMVRRAPDQFLWMHRYWKARPRFEKEGKPFPEPLRDKLRALPWMTDESLGRIVERSRIDSERIRAGA